MWINSYFQESIDAANELFAVSGVGMNNEMVKVEDQDPQILEHDSIEVALRIFIFPWKADRTKFSILRDIHLLAHWLAIRTMRTLNKSKFRLLMILKLRTKVQMKSVAVSLRKQRPAKTKWISNLSSTKEDKHTRSIPRRSKFWLKTTSATCVKRISKDCYLIKIIEGLILKVRLHLNYPDISANFSESHPERRPFQCDTCGKRYTVKTTLQYHQKRHSGMWFFYWIDTNFYFNLENYEMKRPHECNTCGKSFASKRDLRRHEISHSREHIFWQFSIFHEFRERILEKGICMWYVCKTILNKRRTQKTSENSFKYDYHCSLCKWFFFRWRCQAAI